MKLTISLTRKLLEHPTGNPISAEDKGRALWVAVKTLVEILNASLTGKKCSLEGEGSLHCTRFRKV